MIDETDNQKSLFKIVNNISNNKHYNILLKHSSSQELTNGFGVYFTSKIVKLHEKLDSIRDASPPLPESNKRSPPAKMDTIPPATPT